MTINVIFSEWIPAQFSVKDETVFAVGDVHGCGEELGALLSAIEETSAEISHQKRLIFLGDVIDRGPGNIKALKLWAEPAGARGLDKVDRLMGNHEQLLLLAMADSPHSQKAEMMWLSEAIGGSVLLGEMRAAAPGAQEHTYTALFKEALGGRLFDLFTTMASHVEIGNALFVHGGLDPNEDVAEFLSHPWQSFTEAFDKVSPSKFSNAKIAPGARVRLTAPGAGGYGPVAERPADMIAEDLREGWITPEGARRDYGYDGDN